MLIKAIRPGGAASAVSQVLIDRLFRIIDAVLDLSVFQRRCGTPPRTGSRWSDAVRSSLRPLSPSPQSIQDHIEAPLGAARARFRRTAARETAHCLGGGGLLQTRD